MSLAHRALPLPIHAPTPPDRFLCQHQPNAQRINPLDCQHAVDLNWPSTHNYLRYYLTDPRPSSTQSIPSYYYLGSCHVALESAGPPEHLPHSLLLRPSELRGLAGYLIEKCPVEQDGSGGWLTLGFTSALSYIHHPENETWGGNFLTISVQPRAQGGPRVFEPGSRDANIAARLSMHAAGLGRALGDYGAKQWYDAIARNLHNRALEIQGAYNQNLTWWSKNGQFSWWAARFARPKSLIGHFISNLTNSTDSGALGDDDTEEGGSGRERGRNRSFSLTGSAGSSDTEDEEDDLIEDLDDNSSQMETGDSDTDLPKGSSKEVVQGEQTKPQTQDDFSMKDDVGDMTYQCDDNLGGAPNPVDCEKLSWSGLKPPDSIETLQPNVPKFYSQGTCGFAISSLAPTTILWSHLITAFETLNMFCVQNPIAKIKGGRAYYGKQAVSSWINGKVRRDSSPGNDSDGGGDGGSGGEVDGRSEKVSAMEALPPGINATIFRHDPGSPMACEWGLVEEGKNLSRCRGD